MLLTFCILFCINLLIFVAGLCLAVLNFRHFQISLHLLLISLLSFVVMFICFLFHKKHLPTSTNVGRSRRDIAFLQIFKICSNRNGEHSWRTTIAKRSKNKNSHRCRRCQAAQDVEGQISKTTVAVKSAHLNRSLRILTKNYANYGTDDLPPASVRRKIASTKSLSSPLRRKSNDLVELENRLTKKISKTIISQDNGPYETLQELISLHSQASLLSGGSFPLHERFGPGLVSPEGMSEESHCSRMETVDLKKFLRSKTCQQIEIDKTKRAPAPPLKFITRLTQSSASLNLSQIPVTRTAKISTVSQQYVSETTIKTRKSDRQHRILVKYIPVRNEWIHKSDHDEEKPTSKCDIMSLSHFINKCA